MEEYQGAHYEVINKLTRQKGAERIGKALDSEGLTRAEVRMEVRVLDATFNDHALSENIVTYRGTKFRNDNEFTNWTTVGNIVRDKGFSSSSLSKQTAASFVGISKNPTFFEIRMPAGTRAGYVDAAMKHRWETEIINPRRTSFRVVENRGKVTIFGRKATHVILEAIPHKRIK